MAMVSLQGASVQDARIRAMRLLAHLPLHDVTEANDWKFVLVEAGTNQYRETSRSTDAL